MSSTSSAVAEIEVNELHFDTTLPWNAVVAPNVLIVEDDADVQRGWTMFLRHQGYEVTTCDDGATGLSAVEDLAPDVVLLDLGLPGMHGYKVLHEMRMRGHRAHVVVVTAAASPDTERRAEQLGASAVLQKPVSPHQLVGLIERLLGG